MSYRPEDWYVDKIKEQVAIFCNADGKPSHPSYDSALIEAGADAMLEGLKKDGLYVKDGQCFPYKHSFPILYYEEPVFTVSGWLVFIPEED